MAAILKLEEQGKLSTEDPLTKFFDNVPEDKQAITINHLLTMRSGLHEYHDRSGDFEEMDRVEAFRRIMNQQLRFQPGGGKGYSNSGYAVLAMIIEEVSGQPYMTYLREHIFDPAGMNHTGFYQDRLWTEEQVAYGYDARTFGNRNSPFHWPPITWACIGGGCQVSSPGDLGKWLEAINTNKVLSEKTRQLYGTYRQPGQTEWGGATLGLAGAADFGFSAGTYQFPESGSYVFVTANSAKMAAPSLARTLARMLFGIEPAPTTEVVPAAPGSPSGSWGLPGSPAGQLLSAFLDAVTQDDATVHRSFIESNFTSGFLKAFPMEEHLNTFNQMHKDFGAPDVLGAGRPDNRTAVLSLRNKQAGRSFRLTFELEQNNPPRIAGLDVEEEGKS